MLEKPKEKTYWQEIEIVKLFLKYWLHNNLLLSCTSSWTFICVLFVDLITLTPMNILAKACRNAHVWLSRASGFFEIGLVNSVLCFLHVKVNVFSKLSYNLHGQENFIL